MAMAERWHFFEVAGFHHINILLTSYDAVLVICASMMSPDTTYGLLKFKLGDIGALECACEGSQSGNTWIPPAGRVVI